jgi:hypothetical protein
MAGTMAQLNSSLGFVTVDLETHVQAHGAKAMGAAGVVAGCACKCERRRRASRWTHEGESTSSVCSAPLRVPR